MKRINIFNMVLMIFVIAVISIGCVEEKKEPVSVTTTRISESPTVTGTPAKTTGAESPRAPLYYKVFVDEYYGFKRVIETTYKKEVEYKNLTLIIKTGDTVEWENDGDYILTLVSDNGLWTPGDLRSKLMNNKGMNYTFNKPGNYSFRIKEEPRVLPQTVVVIP